MALVSDVITYAQQISQNDSNGLTNTLGLAYANDGLQDFIRELLSRDIDAAQTQEAYTPMNAGQGTYAWPSDMFSLKTVEVNYTDSNQQNYIQTSAIEVANIQGNTSFDFIRLNQSTRSPLLDNRGDTFEIFPTPTSTQTAGIKIFYFLTPTEFTSTSSTLSYPLTLDYRCLSCKVAALYSKRLEKFDAMKAHEDEYQKRLNKIINILAPNSQQPIEPQGLTMTGWEY